MHTDQVSAVYRFRISFFLLASYATIWKVVIAHFYRNVDIMPVVTGVDQSL